MIKLGTNSGRKLPVRLKGYYFHDGSRLEFTEIVRFVSRTLHKQRYRYQYLRDEQQSFRYDNAPHHLHISTFPHHKHDGQGRIIEADEIALAGVLDEIGNILSK